MATEPLILVATGTSNYFARGIMSGIRDYVEDHEPWELLHVGPYSRARNLSNLQRQHDGVIGLLSEQVSLQAPTVNVAAERLPDCPWVYVNDDEVGRLANAHFQSNGWDRVGYVGPVDSPRWTRLADLTRRRGATALEPLDWTHYGEIPWDERHDRLCNWLDANRRPMAVLTYTDNIGAEVLEAAYAMDRRVPDEVAVLGVNDDRLVCEFVAPPLSSIALAVRRVGYEAARLLDGLMRGKPSPTEPVLIDPIGLVARRSTEHLAVEDEQVRRAMRYIAEHIEDPLSLADIAKAASVSPRSLQRRFQQLLGRSPSEEVRRVRVEAAKRLLIETELPLADIAAATGYLYTTHLSKHMKAYLGCPPMAYRQRFRQNRGA